jgi:hypothetical protein
MERGQTLSVMLRAFYPVPWPHASSGRRLLAVLKNDVIARESGHKGRVKNQAQHDSLSLNM